MAFFWKPGNKCRHQSMMERCNGKFLFWKGNEWTIFDQPELASVGGNKFFHRFQIFLALNTTTFSRQRNDGAFPPDFSKSPSNLHSSSHKFVVTCFMCQPSKRTMVQNINNTFIGSYKYMTHRFYGGVRWLWRAETPWGPIKRGLPDRIFIKIQ